MHYFVLKNSLHNYLLCMFACKWYVIHSYVTYPINTQTFLKKTSVKKCFKHYSLLFYSPWKKNKCMIEIIFCQFPLSFSLDNYFYCLFCLHRMESIEIPTQLSMSMYFKMSSQLFSNKRPRKIRTIEFSFSHHYNK